MGMKIVLYVSCVQIIFTILQALIEKEWLGFGHKFTERCGLVQGDPKEVAPVFTQFIDAVWQLTQQFPSSFQFNERFLLTIHDHVYSCQFGTFIGNCEKDRVDLRLSERTYSLWGYLMNHLSEFLNPLYRRDLDDVLHPSPAPQTMKFWRGMYNRFENGVHPREPLGDMLVAAKDHISSLEDHVVLLQKRINQLKTALGHAETPSKDIDCSMVDSGLADDFAQKLQLEKTSHDMGDAADSGFENGSLKNGNVDGNRQIP
ncbi:myotubularin-related protein 6-like [Stegodyphus dumicola]|uniref:myotubularin-related protein 6-like n=1 Tax=Stegodyphus dumicola TaxID=202533 RepID=UPI0015A89797|nr:myotubularin-related protein 6-like [Stegodyphus dumicola]